VAPVLKERVMALPAARTLDVSDSDDLRRVVEAARASGQPLVLRVGNDNVAILTPLIDGDRAGRSSRRAKTPADRGAFRSAFGGWKGLVDGEELKRQAFASRGSNRPLVELRSSLGGHR